MVMRAIQKNLEKNSRFNEYDEDGDGVVSDEELLHLKEIKETEAALRKQLGQLRMARWTLIGMGVFTTAMFLPWVPLERVEALLQKKTFTSNAFSEKLIKRGSP